jgi:histidyl-tRNA synthetase
MLNEAELLQIIHEVFKALKINVTIKINNRKILAGIADLMGTSDKLTDITVALDKLDKIGQEKVIQELAGRGIPASAIEKLMPVFAIQGDTGEKLSFLKQLLMNSEIGREGIQEISSVLEILKKSWASFSPELDITLARGLDYYTGAIIEVKANDVEIGSICGGGRYDNLTGVFGLPGTPGVGISFGADRIYDVLMQLGLFPDEDLHTTRAMFVNFGEKESQYCLPILKSLRDKNITAEIYPDAAKMKKQMAYADKKNIPFVVLAGENEIENGTLTLKNMRSGEQENIKPENLPTKITS